MKKGHFLTKALLLPSSSIILWNLNLLNKKKSMSALCRIKKFEMMSNFNFLKENTVSRKLPSFNRIFQKSRQLRNRESSSSSRYGYRFEKIMLGHFVMCFSYKPFDQWKFVNFVYLWFISSVCFKKNLKIIKMTPSFRKRELGMLILITWQINKFFVFYLFIIFNTENCGSISIYSTYCLILSSLSFGLKMCLFNVCTSAYQTVVLMIKFKRWVFV